MATPQVSELRKEGTIDFDGTAYKVTWKELSYAQQVDIANGAMKTNRKGDIEINNAQLLRQTILAAEPEVDEEKLSTEQYLKLPSAFGAALSDLVGLRKVREQEEAEAKK